MGADGCGYFLKTTMRLLLVPFVLFETPQMLAVLVKVCVFTTTAMGVRPAAAPRGGRLLRGAPSRRAPPHLEGDVAARAEQARQLREHGADEGLPVVQSPQDRDGTMPASMPQNQHRSQLSPA